MPKSLLDLLPEIVAQGRKQAEKIIESIERRHRVSLQTREVVLPARDSNVKDWITLNERDDHRATLEQRNTAQSQAWINRIPRCRIPDDCIDSKRYPLFMARQVMGELIDNLGASPAVHSGALS